MQSIYNLIMGFIKLLEPTHFGLMALASVLGIAIGALPGLTAAMSIALLSSITYGMDPEYAIPMLIALYASGIYAGSISAVLLNIPGTPSAAATSIDGYLLAQKGRAGEALGYARTASFWGGIIGVMVLAMATPPLIRLALKFGPWEYFVLAIMGVMVSGSLSMGQLQIKGWITGFLGLLVSMIGVDTLTLYPRYTFGNLFLMNGISLIPALIGLFGFSEVLYVMSDTSEAKLTVDPKSLKVGMPILQTLRYWKTIIRSSIIGVIAGAIPGVGEDIAAWLGYAAAKNTNKEIGKGEIEGVIAAEVANNAAIGGASIPLLSLGVPGSGAAAVLMGGIMLHGIRPGPLISIEKPQFIYDYIAMQLMANVMLLVFGLILSNLFVKVLLIKKDVLMPIVATLCVIGSYAVNNSIFDVYVAIALGVLGYILRIYGYPLAPFTLGLILGTMADENLRRGLMLSNNAIYPFFTRPVTLVLWLLIVVMTLWRSHRAKA